MTFKMTVFAALAVAAAAAGAADAAPAVYTQVVHKGGLDLSRPADARVFLRRLETAALEVCGSGRGSDRSVQSATLRSDCYRDALKGAVLAVKAPVLETAYAQAHPARPQGLASTR